MNAGAREARAFTVKFGIEPLEIIYTFFKDFLGQRPRRQGGRHLAHLQSVTDIDLAVQDYPVQLKPLAGHGLAHLGFEQREVLPHARGVEWRHHGIGMFAHQYDIG